MGGQIDWKTRLWASAQSSLQISIYSLWRDEIWKACTWQDFTHFSLFQRGNTRPLWSGDAVDVTSSAWSLTTATIQQCAQVQLQHSDRFVLHKLPLVSSGKNFGSYLFMILPMELLREPCLSSQMLWKGIKGRKSCLFLRVHSYYILSWQL